MAYNWRKGASRGQVLLLVLLIFVMLAGVGYLVYTQVFSGPAFVEKTVELVYQRDILRDGGKAQRLESFVSTGVPLSGVFSKERLVSFDPPQGVGLSVVFRTMSGTTVQKVEKFTLEPWRSYYETDHPVRKSRVRAKQAEFEAMAAKFCPHR